MSPCPEKFPLSWLYEKIDYDDRFAAEALAIRESLETYLPSHRRSTHTVASSAKGLVNHWLVQRDLSGYERGRLVEDFAALSMIPFDGCHEKGIANLESIIFIMRDELVALMTQTGMTIPDYLCRDHCDSLQEASAIYKSPEGITKQEVLIAFESLVDLDLAGLLADNKGIYRDAQTQKGTRGGKHLGLWNPVILAVGLNDKHSVPLAHLKRAFTKHHFLNKWQSEWVDQLNLLGE